MTCVLGRLDEPDQELFRRAAARKHPLLDRVLPPLARRAGYGLLRLAVGLLLGPPPAPAPARGCLSP